MAIKLSDYINGSTTPRVVQFTSDPTSSNDGHNIGTIWVNTSTDEYFICTDNTASSAVWSSGGGGSITTSTSDPSSTDDSFDVGTIWVNTSSDEYFICTDNTSSAAVWSVSGKTDEEIQDIVGAMVTSNTETNITVTYDDPSGKLDFVVATATDSTLGVASFNSSYFTVSSLNNLFNTWVSISYSLWIKTTDSSAQFIVGTATESVIRLLSEFKQDSFIELQGRKIKIINYIQQFLYALNLHKFYLHYQTL